MIFEAERHIDLPTTDLLSYIFDKPEYDQNKPIYIDVHNPSRSISCNQARTIIRKLIAGFRAVGVKEGDCIAIHSFNDILYCMLVLAIIGVGGVYTGTNPAYTTAELSHHIETSKSRFLISEPEILESLLEAANENDIPRQNIWILDALGQLIPPGHKSWKELLNFGEQSWVRFKDAQSAKTRPAARLFSSGTTGLPKGANLTHYNLISQQELVNKAHSRPYTISKVVALPIFHAAAAPSTHVSALASGEVIYMMRRFELQSYLRAIEKYGATEMGAVPPIILAIVMSPFSRTRPFMKSIRNVMCGAAPLSKELQARLLEFLEPGVPFNQVWGMTETSCIATLFAYPEKDDTGSVGRLIPNLEAKLTDDDGNNISAFGVRGEICIRGPTIIPGYFDNPKANAESFDKDAFFKTGDIGWCDEATRKWYIVDRKKELIKVRGFQVAPPELEAVLLSHPQVIDAAVIGVPHPSGDGEAPRAYVIRRPGFEGQKLTEEDLKKYLGGKLAKYKALVGGVKFVESIPKNASGKILERLLREQSKEALENGLKKSKL